MQKVLVSITSAPYGTAAMVEGFRFAIGMASLDIETAVALDGDGVFAVYPGQDPAGLNMKSLGEAFANIESFGVKLLVLADALQERGIAADAVLAGAVIDRDELCNRIEQSDGVVSF